MVVCSTDKFHCFGFFYANTITSLYDSSRVDFENWAEFAESLCGYKGGYKGALATKARESES
jgi:hypothetical protein